MPLKPIIYTCPFVKWGLDFIGPINPPSSTRHTLILIATDYFTNCPKLVPLKNDTDENVITFFEENILPRFRVLVHIVTNNGPTFISHKVSLFGINLTLSILSSHLIILKVMDLQSPLISN